MLHFVFELPDPARFPAFGASMTDADREVLSRYRDAAEDLATSTLLSGQDRVTVKFPDGPGPEEVLMNFSSNEAVRGTTVLFRQFDAPEKEPASFLAAQRVLRALTATDPDDDAPTREAILGAWGKARSRLRATSLKILVGQKLRDQGEWAGAIPGEQGLSPQNLISVFQYGDLIHWGDKRSQIIGPDRDPFAHAWQRLAFLDAVLGLSHLYMGFSLIVRAALGEASSGTNLPGPPAV